MVRLCLALCQAFKVLCIFGIMPICFVYIQNCVCWDRVLFIEPMLCLMKLEGFLVLQDNATKVQDRVIYIYGTSGLYTNITG